jgi:hypothetical protein
MSAFLPETVRKRATIGLYRCALEKGFGGIAGQANLGNISREDSLMKKAAVVFITLIAAASTTARTITVDDDNPADFDNIQAAIDDANN